MTANDEQWKDIPSWSGLYQASSHGRIRSVLRTITRPHPRNPNVTQTRTVGGKILSPKVGRGGYLYVNLWNNNDSKMCAVHRLVCEAFHGASSLDVNHINGTKDDNSIQNLEWLSRKENLHHAATKLGITPVWELNRQRAANRRKALH